MQNLWRHNRVNKQLQYTYCPLFHKKRQPDNKNWLINRINKRNIFPQISCRRWGREAMWIESKWSAAFFQFISIVFNLTCIKNKLCKTLDYWSKDMLNFELLEKGLGINFSPYLVYDFSRFFFSGYILLTDQISLLDCFYFLRHWSICVF